jgi:hypothetical protein
MTSAIYESQAIFPHSMRLKGATMLTARLEEPIGPHNLPVGPSSYFRVIGDVLQSDDGSEVASYRGGMWRNGNKLYIAVSFETPVCISFDVVSDNGEKHEFGPYERLRIVDGSIWVMENHDSVLLANFNSMTNTWHAYHKPTFNAQAATIKAVVANAGLMKCA